LYLLVARFYQICYSLQKYPVALGSGKNGKDKTGTDESVCTAKVGKNVLI
jgi:hypothetical protein